MRPNVRVEAGPAAKPQARTMENSASPLCGPGVLMLGLASNEGLGVTGRCAVDDEDKARELVTRLFGVSAKMQDAWPFEVPDFTMDAQSCRKVVAAIVDGDEKLRIVFDRRVKSYLAEIGWVDGWATRKPKTEIRSLPPPEGRREIY